METLEPTRGTFTVSFIYDYMTINVTVETDITDNPDSDSAIDLAWSILNDEYGITVEPNDTNVECWGYSE
jgi:hypothetical protein